MVHRWRPERTGVVHDTGTAIYGSGEELAVVLATEQAGLQLAGQLSREVVIAGPRLSSSFCMRAGVLKFRLDDVLQLLRRKGRKYQTSMCGAAGAESRRFS